NLDLDKEEIAKVSTQQNATPATLQKTISAEKPTYTFYRHAATGEVLFIYCCPAGCSVKERMTYAASKGSVLEMAASEAGVEVSKKMEISDVDEIDEAGVLRELEPEKPATGGGGGAATAGGFARPKRPGRR
ncbi:MAG: hypothetical protein Q9162_007008, partial [Coniocarpon cinnabarinum]